MKEIIKKINNFFKEDINLDKIENPSKNKLFIANTKNKKYLLKIYTSNKYFKSIKGQTFLSNHLEAIPKIILSDNSKKFILMDYIKKPTLKEKRSMEDYKRAIDLLIKIQKLDIKEISERRGELLFFYDKKIQEFKKRISQYLPVLYDKTKLIKVINNLFRAYPLIKNSNICFVHGDYVDRNILADENLKLIDFENGHLGHRSEDLLFFIESIPSEYQNEIYDYYVSKEPFLNDDKIIIEIMKIIIKLRFLGSLLRIKNKGIGKYSERIKDYISSVFKMVDYLNENGLNLLSSEKYHWNQTYSKNKDIFGEPHELISLVDLSKAKNALDLGCGTGRHIHFLAKEGLSVVGVDNSINALNYVKDIISLNNLKCKLKLIDFYQKLPFNDNKFDLVLSCQAIHHNRIENIKKLIKEIFRVLKNNGQIFITVPKLRDISYKDPIEVETNTFIFYKGHEKGIVHHYFTKEELLNFFNGLKITIHEDDKKHYVIVGTKC